MSAGTKKELPFNLQFTFAVRDDRELAQRYGTQTAAQIKHLLHTLAARLPNINVGSTTLLGDLCWTKEDKLSAMKKLAVESGWLVIPHQGTGPGDPSRFAVRIPRPASKAELPPDVGGSRRPEPAAPKAELPPESGGGKPAELPPDLAGTTPRSGTELPPDPGGQREQVKKTNQVIKDEDDDLDLGKGLAASPAPGSPAAPDLEKAILAKYPDCDLEETRAMLTRLHAGDLPGHNFAVVNHPQRFVESKYKDLITAHRAAPATDPELVAAVELFYDLAKADGVTLAAKPPTVAREFGEMLEEHGQQARVLPVIITEWGKAGGYDLDEWMWRKFVADFPAYLGWLARRIDSERHRAARAKVTPEQREVARQEHLADVEARRKANEASSTVAREAWEGEEAARAARDAARRERIAARKQDRTGEVREPTTAEEKAEQRRQRRLALADSDITDELTVPSEDRPRRRRVTRCARPGIASVRQHRTDLTATTTEAIGNG